MNTPSVKTLTERLNLDRDQASQIKDLISGKTEPENMPAHCHYSHKINAILEACNDIGEFAGVEYIADNRDRDNFRDCYGLSYLNSGDTYTPTLIYDHATGQYCVASIGYFAEHPRHARRFE